MSAGKDKFSEGAPIKTAIVPDDLLAEVFNDAVVYSFSRLHQPATHFIRVDHGCAQFGKHFADGGFAAPETAGKTDSQHRSRPAAHGGAGRHGQCST